MNKAKLARNAKGVLWEVRKQRGEDEVVIPMTDSYVTPGKGAHHVRNVRLGHTMSAVKAGRN